MSNAMSKQIAIMELTFAMTICSSISINRGLTIQFGEREGIQLSFGMQLPDDFYLYMFIVGFTRIHFVAVNFKFHSWFANFKYKYT